MSPDKEEVPHARIDISTCLDAVNMYDAAYHRDRDNPHVPQAEPPTIVSLWEYVLAMGRKTGIGLLGSGLFLMILIATGLIVANGVHNIYEYIQSRPVIRTGICPDPKAKGIVLNADGPNTWSEPSPYPLPPEWVENNLRLYGQLFIVIFLSHFGSVRFLRKAKQINTGVPIQYADTAHLPAHESLVRASQEPALETLVRAAEEPVQKTLVRSATPPSDLLRSAGLGHETSSEQLVRASEGGPQD
jgi:hypothetical protein